MKRRKDKETWEQFEARVGSKRSGTEKKSNNITVPHDILVQRMSSTPSGRLKKFEPLDTRDFVPFDDYEELAIDTIKEACEKFYNAPQGSCDILASDRGPSCTKIEQIRGKKVYFIRFLPPKVCNELQTVRVVSTVRSASAVELKTAQSVQAPKSRTFPKSSAFPKSVSVSELLKAGTLVKPKTATLLELESFDVANMKWNKQGSIKVEVEGSKFASGAFRDAFKATAGKEVQPRNWVIKEYQKKAVKTIKEDLSMTLEDHTRKQVQMHCVSRNIAKHFSKSAPSEFGKTFEYNKVLFTLYKDFPATIEEFVEGDFHKFVNNDGECVAPPSPEFEEIYEKAQCLTHYSYQFSGQKLMLLDIQGSATYTLYDPEIATTELFANGDESQEQKEVYFCAGNLSTEGINAFIDNHVCNKFCDLMSLDALA